MSEGYEKRAEPFPEADYAELQKRETLAMLSPVIYKEGENEMSTQKLFVTKREKNWDEFVKLTEAGKSCKETADALGVSIQSVHLWRAELKKQRASEKSEEIIKPEPVTKPIALEKIELAPKETKIESDSAATDRVNIGQSEEEIFTRSYLQRIDLLIDTMAPICAGDDNALQETAKLAYKILLHGLSDEFPTDEAKSEMVAINE